MNYCDAMKSQESDLWLEVMNEEINSIKNNGVWELCDLPKNRKVIGCK